MPRGLDFFISDAHSSAATERLGFGFCLFQTRAAVLPLKDLGLDFVCFRRAQQRCHWKTYREKSCWSSAPDKWRLLMPSSWVLPPLLVHPLSLCTPPPCAPPLLPHPSCTAPPSYPSFQQTKQCVHTQYMCGAELGVVLKCSASAELGVVLSIGACVVQSGCSG